MTTITDAQWHKLINTRLWSPQNMVAALRERKRRPLLRDDGHMFLIAVDHPARNAVAVGENPMAMADRRDLLDRTIQALDNERVDGVMATPDLLEELAVLGALENKLAMASINRGGLLGTSWEMDDPVTASTPASIVADRLDGGKVLLRINEEDPGTLKTMVMVAEVVSQLAEAGVVTLVEPLPYKTVDGRQQLVKDTDALIKAIGVASSLGARSAYTWLKLPVWAEPERVLAATSMPTLLLGGVPSGNLDADIANWASAVAIPQVRGYVVGRSLLYPPDDDVSTAVHRAATALNAAIEKKEDR